MLEIILSVLFKRISEHRVVSMSPFSKGSGISDLGAYKDGSSSPEIQTIVSEEASVVVRSVQVARKLNSSRKCSTTTENLRHSFFDFSVIRSGNRFRAPGAFYHAK